MIKLSLAALLCFATCLSLLADEKPPLRLLTYNIHAGIGMDKQFDLERIAEVILSVAPDVVALQEVDVMTTRSGGVDIATRLGELTGMRSIFGASIEFGGGQYGNAILTKLPLERTQVIRIPQSVVNEERSILSADLLFHGDSIRVLSTHFCHREESNRDLGAEEVLASQEGSDLPTFLMGDLNALPDASPLRKLIEGGWQMTSDEPLSTVPVTDPTRQIDYILFRSPRGETVQITEAKVLDEAVASDHRALFVELRR